MKLEAYNLGGEDIYSENFEFYSEGEKRFLMVVNYSFLGYENLTNKPVYNLGFGVLTINPETGQEEIDDKIKTNNGDKAKILATVALTAKAFFSKHPTSIIYFEGSSPSRIRTYQILISQYYDILEEDFFIRCYQAENELPVEFQKNKNYFSFLIEKR